MNKVDYDFKYSFRTYLYTIAKSRALNYVKKMKKIVPIEDATIYIDEEQNIEENYIKREEILKLNNAILRLKKEYQIIIYIILLFLYI